MSPLEITDVGGTPYALIRRILIRIDNAAQLRQLEIASPHLEGDDAECWIRLIEKDFPTLSRRHNFEPRNPTSWHKVYEKYRRIEEEQKLAAEERLKNAFSTIRKEKATNVSQIMDFDRRRMPKPPVDIKSSAAGSRIKGSRRTVDDTSGLRFSGGSRTKVTTAKSILNKAKREAKEIKARNRLATPTGLLPVRGGQIVRAPKSMVNEERVKAQPAVAPHPPRQRHPQLSRPDPELEEREARLRKLKGGSSAPKKAVNYVSDDELDYQFNVEDDYASPDDFDNDGGTGKGLLSVDDLEGIFDDDEPSSKPAASYSTHKRSSSYTASAPVAAARSSYKRSGLLSNAPGSSSASKVRVAGPSSSTSTNATSPSKTTTSRAPPQQSSPPLGSRASSAMSPPLPATSPDLAPQSGSEGGMMPRKRKPVDVFMKPKASKAPRR